MSGKEEDSEQVFLAALQIREPAARFRYVQRRCAGNELLRREVESLLAAHEQAGEFLEAPPPQVQAFWPFTT
jgi:hypothetical protein